MNARQRQKEVARVRRIIRGGRPQYDAPYGRERVETATCGQCGRSWNNARISELTPAPSARCPFEYAHEYPDEYATMRPLGDGWWDVWAGAVCLKSCLKHTAALRFTRAHNRRLNLKGGRP